MGEGSPCRSGTGAAAISGRGGARALIDLGQAGCWPAPSGCAAASSSSLRQRHQRDRAQVIVRVVAEDFLALDLALALPLDVPRADALDVGHVRACRRLASSCSAAGYQPVGSSPASWLLPGRRPTTATALFVPLATYSVLAVAADGQGVGALTEQQLFRRPRGDRFHDLVAARCRSPTPCRCWRWPRARASVGRGDDGRRVQADDDLLELLAGLQVDDRNRAIRGDVSRSGSTRTGSPRPEGPAVDAGVGLAPGPVA